MRKSEAKAAARAAGELFYVAEHICPHGHSPTIRYTSTGKCVACCKTEGVRYKAKRTVYSRANSSQVVARVTAWKKANPERVKQLCDAYRERNRDALRLKNLEYHKTHPTPKIDRRIRENNRRSRQHGAGGRYTKHDIEHLFETQGAKCGYCKASLKAGFQIDHIIPIVLGGSSNPSNLQLLCRSCNTSKGGKHPIDFAKARGLLV